jgi:hypothetical protein
MFIDMIDYLLEIGTRNGAYMPVSGRDVADARRNGKAWLSCPGARTHAAASTTASTSATAMTARCGPSTRHNHGTGLDRGVIAF